MLARLPPLIQRDLGSSSGQLTIRKLNSRYYTPSSDIPARPRREEQQEREGRVCSDTVSSDASWPVDLLLGSFTQGNHFSQVLK